MGSRCVHEALLALQIQLGLDGPTFASCFATQEDVQKIIQDDVSDLRIEHVRVILTALNNYFDVPEKSRGTALCMDEFKEVLSAMSDKNQWLIVNGKGHYVAVLPRNLAS